MDIEEKREGETQTLILKGDLDLYAAGALDETVNMKLSSDVGELVLDMKGVPYIDSAGLGALVGLRKALNARGVKLTVADPSEDVRKIIHLTRLEKILNVTPT